MRSWTTGRLALRHAQEANYNIDKAEVFQFFETFRAQLVGAVAAVIKARSLPPCRSSAYAGR
jgi:hypothetical protein